jgi:hypothetical protein
MLTYQECLDLCELEEDEVDAIAEHEHLTEVAAMELGNYLIHSPEGVPMIKQMILEDIERARARRNIVHAAKLKLVLKHFIETHPEHPSAG